MHFSGDLDSSSPECSAAKEVFHRQLSSQNSKDIVIESLAAFLDQIKSHESCAAGLRMFLDELRE